MLPKRRTGAKPPKRGAVCRDCGGRARVIQSVKTKRPGFHRRRRECEDCGSRWSSMEVPLAVARYWLMRESREKKAQKKLERKRRRGEQVPLWPGVNPRPIPEEEL